MSGNSIKLRGVIIASKRTVEPPEPGEGKIMVPLYNIPMMSDEEWNRLADQNQKERLVIQ